MTSSEIDSEELEELENAADEEETDEEALQAMLEAAEQEFPDERLRELTRSLQDRGVSGWIQEHVIGKPFHIQSFLLAVGVLLPEELRSDDIPPIALLPILKTVLIRLLRRRERLSQHNTPDDAIELIKNARKIVVLTGAGISVSCGIPDFRSRDGIYASLASKYDLDEPENMFDMEYFMSNPSVFFDFAHSIFPSNFKPSPSHRFLKLLQDRSQLLRNYTQNIDTLEQAAGITRVLQCHGSFATATCTDKDCRHRVEGSMIKEDIFAQRVPRCPLCQSRERAANEGAKARTKKQKGSNGRDIWKEEHKEDGDDDQAPPGLGVLKPDITFFGEKLSDAFETALIADRIEADLIIVMGTSLKVAPVAELLTHMPHRLPVILINKTPILHFQTDIMLLGSSDEIVQYICHKLAWKLPEPDPVKDVVGASSAAEDVDIKREDVQDIREPVQWEGSEYVWTWPGAEVEMLERLVQSQKEDGEEEEHDSEVSEDDEESGQPAVEAT